MIANSGQFEGKDGADPPASIVPGAAPVPPGGAPLTLNMESDRDRAMVRRAIKAWPGRWRGLDSAKKARLVESLMLADQHARSILDPAEAAKALTSIVRTGVAMEGQQQADQHKAYAAIVPTTVQHAHLHLVKVIKGVDPEQL